MIPLYAPARRVTAWIAALAILLGGLLPPLSHALPSAEGGRSFVQVCTVAGMKRVPVDEPRADNDESVFLAERCAFCATHGQPAMLPPGLTPVLVLPRERDRFPWLYDHEPPPQFVWIVPIPRGPPAGPDTAAAAIS